jgi:chemotaxis protein CheZ
MSEEPSAISKIPPVPAAQGDYDSICAALMHTERGRWFLQEYARRNRSADTQVLLAAIERIEAVVCAERNKQAQQGFRTDLLEMAKAITRTRAEVAEVKSDAAARAQPARPDSDASPVPRRPQPRDVFAAAERIRDVTWAMRGHGFDPSTCDQLEELAASILSASSLRDPTDHRASKLSEVLQYLERRIDTLLESSADREAAPEPPDRAAFAPTPTTGKAGPENGFASAFVTQEYERDRGHSEAGPAPIKFYGAPAASAVEIALPEDPAIEPPACDPPTGDGDLSHPPSADFETAPARPISAQNHEDGAQTSDHTAPSARGAVDSVEPTFAGHTAAEPLSSPDGDTAEFADEPSVEPSAAAADRAATPAQPPAAGPRDAFLPAVELPGGSSYTLPKSSEVQAAATALREAAARAFLPELDMRADLPGLGAAPAGGVLPAASIPPEAHAATPEPAPPAVDLATEVATDVDEGHFAALGPAEPTLDTAPEAPDQPAAPEDVVQAPAPAEWHTAPLLAVAAPMPQPPRSDPLAALKAMSDDELIALFS